MLLENMAFWSTCFWICNAFWNSYDQSYLKKIRRGIFSFSSETECNRRQINNYNHHVPQNDVFRTQLKKIPAAGT